MMLTITGGEKHNTVLLELTQTVKGEAIRMAKETAEIE